MKTILVLLLAPFIIVFGAQKEDLNPEEFYQVYQKQRKNPAFVFMDVRTPEEYRQGHLFNAILVDLNSPDFESKIETFNKNKKYYLYCRSGRRSRAALDIMKAKGFKHVAHLSGGIIAWTNKGYPLQR